MNNMTKAVMATLLVGMLAPLASATITVDASTDRNVGCETGPDPTRDVWRLFDGVYANVEDCDAYASYDSHAIDARCPPAQLGPAFRPEAEVERDCDVVVRT